MQLPYETAKKLKEAGFPFRLCSSGADWTGGGIFKFDDEIVCYEPSSDELIVALGDDFNELSRQVDFDTRELKGYCAYAWGGETIEMPVDNDGKMEKTECDPYCCGYGKGQTPAEALANLYIIRHDTRTPR